MSEERDTGKIAEDLKRLQPARSELDSRIVFYEAGFNAGKTQQTAAGRIKIAPLIAAGLLAAIVTASASYRVGQSAAMQAKSETNVTLVQADHNSDADTAEDLLDVDPSPRIETTNRSRREERLASWIDSLHDLAETARIERQTGTTLAAFHSSLVERENSASWGDFPFPLTSQVNRHSSNGSYDIGYETMPAQPLAVSDLRELAMSLEATR